jgi:hypothetical protein
VKKMIDNARRNFLENIGIVVICGALFGVSGCNEGFDCANASGITDGESLKKSPDESSGDKKYLR